MKKQILFLASFLVLCFTACEQEAVINPVDDVVEETIIQLHGEELEGVLEQVEELITNQQVENIESRGCDFVELKGGYQVLDSSSDDCKVYRIWARNNPFPPANEMAEYVYGVVLYRYNNVTRQNDIIDHDVNVTNARTITFESDLFINCDVPYEAQVFAYVRDKCNPRVGHLLFNKFFYY